MKIEKITLKSGKYILFDFMKKAENLTPSERKFIDAEFNYNTETYTYPLRAEDWMFLVDYELVRDCNIVTNPEIEEEECRITLFIKNIKRSAKKTKQGFYVYYSKTKYSNKDKKIQNQERYHKVFAKDKKEMASKIMRQLGITEDLYHGYWYINPDSNYGDYTSEIISPYQTDSKEGLDWAIEHFNGIWKTNLILLNSLTIEDNEFLVEKRRNAINQFKTPEELLEHLFFQGTAMENADNIIRYGLRIGTDVPIGTKKGSGYGYKLHSISLSRSPEIASVFTSTSPMGALFTIVIDKESNTSLRDDIEDSEDLEKEIPSLLKEGIDAVRIGDWNDMYDEQELVVLNPEIITIISRVDFRVYKKRKFQMPTIQDAKEIMEFYG